MMGTTKNENHKMLTKANKPKLLTKASKHKLLTNLKATEPTRQTRMTRKVLTKANLDTNKNKRAKKLKTAHDDDTQKEHLPPLLWANTHPTTQHNTQEIMSRRSNSGSKAKTLKISESPALTLVGLPLHHEYYSPGSNADNMKSAEQWAKKMRNNGHIFTQSDNNIKELMNISNGSKVNPDKKHFIMMKENYIPDIVVLTIEDINVLHYKHLHAIHTNINTAAGHIITNFGLPEEAFPATYNETWKTVEAWVKNPQNRQEFTAVLCPVYRSLIHIIYPAEVLATNKHFATPNNLFWEKYDKGGVGYRDPMYANALYRTGQLLNEYSQERITNGFEALPFLQLHTVNVKHLEVSFKGEGPFPQKFFKEYAEIQEEKRKTAFAATSKSKNKTQEGTYSSEHCDLGRVRLVVDCDLPHNTPPFEIKKDIKHDRSPAMYSTINSMIGINSSPARPYSLNSTKTKLDSAVMTSRLYAPPNKTGLPTEQHLKYHVEGQGDIEHRKLPGTWPSGMKTIHLPTADLMRLFYMTIFRWAPIPSAIEPEPFEPLITKDQDHCAQCHGKISYAFIELNYDGSTYYVVKTANSFVLCGHGCYIHAKCVDAFLKAVCSTPDDMLASCRY